MTEDRLSAAGIQVLAEVHGLRMFGRGPFVAMVDPAGQIGSTGIWTDRGLAYLIYRGRRTLFVAKGSEREAAPEEVAALRQFSADLKEALR